MPILSKVGRTSFRSRLRLGAILALLLLGSLAMLYPLLLMLAASTKSVADTRENRILPAFLFSDEALWHKHVEALFNESLDAMNMAFATECSSFSDLPLPPPGEEPGVPWLPAFEAFLDSGTLPPHALALGHYWAPRAGAFPSRLRDFRASLRARYPTLDALNAALSTDFDAWYNVFVQPPAYLFPYAATNASPIAAEFDRFKAASPPLYLTVLSPEGAYRTLFARPRYARDPAAWNAAHPDLPPIAAFSDLRLPPTSPDPARHPLAAEEWQEFTTRSLSPLWLAPAADPAPTANSPDGRPSVGHPSAPPVPPESPVPPDLPSHSPSASPPLRLASPDTLWRDFLARHPNLRPTPASYPPASPLALSAADPLPPMPQLAHHARLFRQNIPALRREFLLRNYRTVLDCILFHGRAILNTLVYCTLAVLLALLVNPLAAYALSRFNLPFATQILFFLMLTMAFPHMVTQIPVFILLRQLGLLNTFAALLLPGMASGYSIFLLKGFFDSLPRDLYESAQLDGAGEWTLFWHITMRLSTPILSVIALQAFSAAYANFMYALLICQSPRMWTLMVWLYQLQQRSGPGVLNASLILAALPTLLVFLLCQRVLLRGIVVPVEK